MSYYLMGQGKLYIALRDIAGKAAGYRLLGNCTAFNLLLGKGGLAALEGDTGGMLEPGVPPGFQIDMESIEEENLAIALSGTDTAIPAGNEAGFQFTAYRGGLHPLPNIGLTNFISLKSLDNTVTYVQDTDYIVRMAAGSIEIPANSAIPDKATVVASYDYQSQSVTGAYTQIGQFYALRYEGVNNAANGEPIIVELKKTQIDPVDELPLLGDNLSVLKVKGRMYYDDQLPATPPEGRFLRIMKLGE